MLWFCNIYMSINKENTFGTVFFSVPYFQVILVKIQNAFWVALTPKGILSITQPLNSYLNLTFRESGLFLHFRLVCIFEMEG